ncbi:MAG TPA: transposase [Blastocatellia bacterium]|nr:transposase [Blastocatellia bacterium]
MCRMLYGHITNPCSYSILSNISLEISSKFEIDEAGRIDETSHSIGSSLTEAIHSVTDAEYYFEAEREKYLNTWIEAVFKVILPDFKSELQRLFKPLKNELSEGQLQIIDGLGLLNSRARKPTSDEEKEIEKLRTLCQSSFEATRRVIDAMAKSKTDSEASQRAVLLWSAMNFPAAALAISIYFEALTFAVQSQKKRKPSDMMWPLLIVYLWRKLGIEEQLPSVEARLRYGKNFEGKGSLYNRALALFVESNPADQEIAADAYCDSFVSNLNRLPTQALLNPKLAMGYLFKSSRRAATRKLPKNRIELVDASSLVSIYEPTEMIALAEHPDNYLEDQLPDEIRTLPNFALFRQRAINKRSLAELGKDHELTGRDRSISKQAVHKRLSRVKNKILEAQKKGSFVPSQLTKRLSDEEWKLIKPLLPTLEPKSKRGGRRKDDRRIMGLVLYKMRSGCPWNDLPKGRTLLARYNEWQAAGVFEQMKRAGIWQELG